MYKKGEYVVKPNTGICTIESIVRMDLAGTGEKEYYQLHPVSDKRAVLYVTVDADRRRLRRVMTRDEAYDFIRKIETIDAAWIENDKQREQSYKAALMSNEPADIVSMIKNMYFRTKDRLAQGKKITATDERYFQLAERILYSELGLAIGEPVEKIKDIITETIEG